VDRSDGGTGTGDPGTDRLVLAGPGVVVGRCRDFVRVGLRARGWLDGADEEQRAKVEDVLLMTSELVTNACLYAGGPRELAVRGDGSRLRVEVVDASPTSPVLRPLTVPARPGGHGLRVVQQLALRWGSDARGDGKAVWFEIDRD
jgi:hypothetical protein